MLCFRCGSYNPENAQKCSVCGQGFVDEAGKAVGPPRRVSHTALPASIFVPGEIVASRYQIGELLGQGGVGAVYRARDMEIDVDVALKAITSNLLQTEEEQQNFSKQIRAARKLQHPNIVRIYDEGHEGNRRFFTMKLLEGLTLRKIIRLRHEKGQPFSAEELVPIFHQLAAALEYAHKTTWHGDVKPENVIVLPDLLKVTDFNLVKALPLKPFLGIAKSRSKGFPYIAPELRVEATTIDGRVDIYALGVILAEMLTGLVFEGHYSRAMTAALEQLPTKLDGLVRKATAEHPDGRFLRATELASELETALGAMTGPLPPPAKPQPPPILGAGATNIPQARPAEGPGDSGAVARAPSPGETGPSHSPAPALSSSLPSDEGAWPPGLDEPSEVVEIGASQVLLLGSGAFTLDESPQSTTSPPDLAAAARRVLALDPRSSSSTDGTDSDDAVAAKDSLVDHRRGAANAADKLGDALAGGALAASVWGDDSQEHGLIPPPIPDEAERSLDMPVQLPGDEDDDTAERDIIAPRGVDDEMPEPISASEGAASELHDALTALSPHPPHHAGHHAGPHPVGQRSDPAQRAAARGSATRIEHSHGAVPPAGSDLEPTDEHERVDDDLHMLATLSVKELTEAKERSSPRLHRAEPLPPPVIAPLSRSSFPLRRSSGGSSTVALGAVLGIVVLAAFVVVWRFVIADVPPEKIEDSAIVRLGDPDEVPATAPPAIVEVAAPAPSPKAVVPARAAPIPPPSAAAATPPSLAGCPNGMARIDGGTFMFGSAANDPMRNFGEVDATSVELKPYCIDYYEQPNGSKTLPTTDVSWQAAKNACERLGRRLCSEHEWERACKGQRSTRFPYGNSYDAAICNTEDSQGNVRALAPATSFKGCKTSFKTYMMAGNAEEWVLDSVGGKKIAKGGAADRPDFASRCSARRPLPARATTAMLGFRCCVDPR
jgi:serine/threonine protein kinase